MTSRTKSSSFAAITNEKLKKFAKNQFSNKLKKRKGMERKSAMSGQKTFQCTRTGTFHFLSVNHTHERMTATKYNFRFSASGRRWIDHCPQKCGNRAQQKCKELLENQPNDWRNFDSLQACPKKLRFGSLHYCVENGFFLSFFSPFSFSYLIPLAAIFAEEEDSSDESDVVNEKTPSEIVKVQDFHPGWFFC